MEYVILGFTFLTFLVFVLIFRNPSNGKGNIENSTIQIELKDSLGNITDTVVIDGNLNVK